MGYYVRAANRGSRKQQKPLGSDLGTSGPSGDKIQD